ncbi:MAG: tetratricopeptide repeat protein [Acidobacteriota bacterium]
MRAKQHLLAIFSLLLVGSFLVPAAAMAQDETWQKAYQAYSQENYGQAERLFRQVIKEYEGWGWAHLMLGVTLQKQRKSQAALDELQAAKEMVTEDEERFQVNHAIAQIRLVQGNFDATISAEGEASKYAKSAEQRGAIAKSLGTAFYNKEQWRKAVENFEKVTGSRASEANVQAMLGRSYYELGNKTKALGFLTKAAQMDRKNRLALYFAGLIYLENKDYTKAVAVAEQAVRADPQDMAIRSMLGRAYLGAKQYKGAAQALENVVAAKPTDGTALYNLGQAYMSSENWAKAIAAYQRAVNLLESGSAAQAACLFDLGFTYEKVGRYDDALAALKDSAKIDASAKVKEAISRVEERIRRAKEKKSGS